MSGLHAGRRILVTGASRGIGLGISRRYAAEGANVVLIAREKAAGEAAAASIREKGGKAQFLQGDLQKLDSIPALVLAAKELLGGEVDTLSHAAGIYPEQPLESMTLSQWKTVLNLNLTSGMVLLRELLIDLAHSDYGRVVMISSITGPRTGIAGLSHYAASKGGLEAFMRAAAVELADRGITVNAVAPGTILTESLQELYDAPGALEAAISAIPVGRIGTPDDIAELVSFLSSDRASYITGQSIIVDGGQTLPEV